jgi:hypothetical protein
LGQPIYPNQFIARVVTALQHDSTSRELHLLGEKAHQRCVRPAFYRLRAQFDLNCATVLTYDAVALSIWNDVHSENCHPADHIRAETNSLDAFWRRMP